jgi:hypothetical protein
MPNWVKEAVTLAVCVMFNVAYIYFITRGVSYPDMFVSGVTASWAFLGFYGYEGVRNRARHNQAPEK